MCEGAGQQVNRLVGGRFRLVVAVWISLQRYGKGEAKKDSHVVCRGEISIVL